MLVLRWRLNLAHYCSRYRATFNCVVFAGGYSEKGVGRFPVGHSVDVGRAAKGGFRLKKPQILPRFPHSILRWYSKGVNEFGGRSERNVEGGDNY